ncbi:unnamed protein product [Adineta ricciae]|uniref:G-protein coupled receptors family 1 profile domain-containing protein n=1 Tax=Adineta ricciae TaxID=249248 RepID=A0A815C5J9_ADIRI|nr:unnamed protein product [Adineta ricciae]CAF1279154.1 unnamed protein product [Adineta ricciae]
MLCLAVIDQYLVTYTCPRWQRWANIKVAHRMTILVSIFWAAHAVLFFIYIRDLSPTNAAICSSFDPMFARYETYGVYLTISNLFPLVAVLFGILAYRNARTLTTRANPMVRRELDKQLTVMVLVEISVYMCTFIPFTITSGFLSLITIDDPVVLAQLNLVNAVVLTWNILSYGSSFYTYIIVSKRFRRQAKYVLYDIYMNRFRQNRIYPNQTEIAITANSVRDV